MASMSEQPPDHAEIAAAQERIAALLRSVEQPAPPALHARIEALTAGRVTRTRRPSPVFGLAGVCAAALVIVLVLVGGSVTPPTAFAAASVALKSPTGPAPGSLVAAGTTIAFPQWSARGWPSSGTRSDSLGGRTVTVEFYRSWAAGTLGYAIVSGAPLHWGAGGHAVARGGSSYWLTGREGGAQIVAWVQDGHTCVLASRTASSTELLALAVAQDRPSSS
jgi:hypothetical protein